MALKLVKEKSPREERIDRFQYLWAHESHQFNSQRNYREQLRLERTWDAIRSIPDMENKKIIDLGCGTGETCLRLKNAGIDITAMDISTIPLENLAKEGIHTIQDCLPRTNLEDNLYDIVICTDVVAYLPENEHRLLFLEISRLIKPDGYVVFSTPLDIYSSDPLEKLLQLAGTEFLVLDWTLSYHALQIRLGKKLKFLRNNVKFIKICEAITQFFYQEDGISHAIFTAKRKQLF